MGARLDQAPDLFFVLRQVDQTELLAGASAADVLATAGAKKASPGKKRIATSAVACVFGIDLDDEPTPAVKKSARKKSARK